MHFNSSVPNNINSTNGEWFLKKSLSPESRSCPIELPLTVSVHFVAILVKEVHFRYAINHPKKIGSYATIRVFDLISFELLAVSCRPDPLINLHDKLIFKRRKKNDTRLLLLSSASAKGRRTQDIFYFLAVSQVAITRIVCNSLRFATDLLSYGRQARIIWLISNHRGDYSEKI